MDQSRVVRLPVHIIKELNLYLRTARRLAQLLDHEPSAEDIAQAIDKPIDAVKHILGLNERVASMDSPLAKDEERPLLDTLPDEKPDPCQLLLDQDLHARMAVWLSQLSEKQRIVMERRFGLNGHEKATLDQVGAAIGVTRERVRQIQLDALRRLRQILESEGFSEQVLHA